VSRIRDLLALSRATKAVLILDCCFGGAVGEAFLRGGVDDQLSLTSRGRGTYIMTAATAIQTAQEKEGDRNGVFTKHLINGIRGGAADEDGDGYVTVGELYNYVHREVLADSPQEPMKWDLNVRGELVVAKSGTSPRDQRRQAIRAKLIGLAEQNQLPDSVFTKAIEVLGLKPSEIAGPLRDYDRLLERLHKGELHVGQFIDGWIKVKPDAAPAAPEPKAPEPRRPAAKMSEPKQAERREGPRGQLPDAVPLDSPPGGWGVVGSRLFSGLPISATWLGVAIGLLIVADAATSGSADAEFTALLLLLGIAGATAVLWRMKRAALGLLAKGILAVIFGVALSLAVLVYALSN
jgi:hypothetical protein